MTNFSHFDFTVLNRRLQEYREKYRADYVDNSWNEMLSYHFEHSRERARERYGLNMTPVDWEAINWMVFREKKKSTQFIAVKNDDITVYNVTYRPTVGRIRTVQVYFSERFFCVTTLVPIESEYEQSLWSDFLKERRQLRWDYAQERIAEFEESNAVSSPFAVLNAMPVVEPTRPILTLPVIPVIQAEEKEIQIEEPEIISEPIQTIEKEESGFMTVITANNQKEIADQIWDAIESENFAEKSVILKSLISELRKKETEMRAVKVTMRVTAKEVLADCIGKSLTLLPFSRWLRSRITRCIPPLESSSRIIASI